MEIAIVVVLGIVMYGFGFFSGSIAAAEDNAKIHNDERQRASIHFNQVSNDKT